MVVGCRVDSRTQTHPHCTVEGKYNGCSMQKDDKQMIDTFYQRDVHCCCFAYGLPAAVGAFLSLLSLLSLLLTRLSALFSLSCSIMARCLRTPLASGLDLCLYLPHVAFRDMLYTSLYGGFIVFVATCGACRRGYNTLPPLLSFFLIF